MCKSCVTRRDLKNTFCKHVSTCINASMQKDEWTTWLEAPKVKWPKISPSYAIGHGFDILELVLLHFE